MYNKLSTTIETAIKKERPQILEVVKEVTDGNRRTGEMI